MKLKFSMPRGTSLIIVAGVLNFFLFICVLILLGGESMPIKTIDGRYLLWGTGGIPHYMSEKHYFEIGKATYLYITIHGYFSVGLLAVLIIKDFMLNLIRRPRA